MEPVTIAWMLAASILAGPNVQAADTSQLTDRVCIAVSDLTATAKKISRERIVESVGGVKDLSRMRDLSEDFIGELKEYYEADGEAEKAGAHVTDFVNQCENITSSDLKTMDAEIKRVALAIAPKGKK